MTFIKNQKKENDKYYYVTQNTRLNYYVITKYERMDTM